MDERKLWRSITESGVLATCSDCSWSHPGAAWQSEASPPEDILRYFRAHQCSNVAETRSARRYTVQLPVKVDGHEDDGAFSTRDISNVGVFLLTGHPLEEQSEIQFTLTLPEPGVRVQCTGIVVRVESREGKRLGVAARIDKYCFIRPNA